MKQKLIMAIDGSFRMIIVRTIRVYRTRRTGFRAGKRFAITMVINSASTHAGMVSLLLLYTSIIIKR